MVYEWSALFSNVWLYAGLIGLFGVIGVLRAKDSKKIATFPKPIVGIVLGALLLLSVYQGGFLSGLGFGKTTLAAGDITSPTGDTITPSNLVTPAPEQQVETKVVGGKICRVQSDGSNSQDVVIRNKENATLGYLSATAAAEPPLDSGKTTFDSATTTAGASLTYTTLNVPGCEEGTIYVLGTAGVGVASSSAPFSSFQEVVKNEIVSANSNVIGLRARDSALVSSSTGLVNGSIVTGDGGTYIVSGSGASDGTAYYTNTSLASGGSINGYIDWTVNGTASVFGTYGASDGALISYDSGTASVFSKNSFSLSDLAGIGLTPVTCPNTITANRNTELCWSIRTLKATDGEIRTKFKLTSDLADVVASNTAPIVCIDDKVYFRDTNGKVAYDFFSSSGTNQGVGGTCMRFVLS